MSGPAEGAGFGATDEPDAGAAALVSPPAAPPPVARRKVEIIDDEDVGCTGKKKKPRENSRRRPPAGAKEAVAAAAADAETAPALAAPVAALPDLNYPAPSPSSMTDGECMFPPPPCCYKKRVGNMYVCCEQRSTQGIPRVLCGWPACWAMQCFTQALVWGIGGPVFYFSFPEHSMWYASCLSSRAPRAVPSANRQPRGHVNVASTLPVLLTHGDGVARGKSRVRVAGCALIILTSFALFRVGTSDPGILPLYRAPGDKCARARGPQNRPTAFSSPLRSARSLAAWRFCLAVCGLADLSVDGFSLG